MSIPQEDASYHFQYTPPEEYYLPQPPSQDDSPSPQTQAESSVGPGRKRPKYTRSKTGCLTCRVKKIKCDETKPKCIRCSNGKRECTWPDGVPGKKKALPRTDPSGNIDSRPSTSSSVNSAPAALRDSPPVDSSFHRDWDLRRSSGLYLPPSRSLTYPDEWIPPIRRQNERLPYIHEPIPLLQPPVPSLSLMPEMSTYHHHHHSARYEPYTTHTNPPGRSSVQNHHHHHHLATPDKHLSLPADSSWTTPSPIMTPISSLDYGYPTPERVPPSPASDIHYRYQ